MKIVGIYSFKNGKETIDQKYPHLFKEVEIVIGKISAQKAKNKKSQEKTMPGKMLFNPKVLNSAFKKEFAKFSWQDHRIPCEYPIPVEKAPGNCSRCSIFVECPGL
ncbi:MAG: hypothetical protein ABIK27_08110 [Bacteroidota bacterium]